jgi:hypothetical protein
MSGEDLLQDNAMSATRAIALRGITTRISIVQRIGLIVSAFISEDLTTNNIRKK